MEAKNDYLAYQIPKWLIHSKNMYLVITNANGDFVIANDHYKDTFLNSSFTLSKLNVTDVVQLDEVKLVSETIKNCILKDVGLPVQLINRHRIKDSGRYKSIKWECSIFECEETTEDLILHIGHEVVAFEKASVTEDHPEKSLNNLFDDLQIGVVVQECDSSISLSNTKAEELLGLTKDQLHGRTIYNEGWDIVKSDGSPFPAEELPAAQAIATKKHIKDVIMGVYNPQQEHYVWFQVDANPQLDHNGELTRVVTAFIDISQRKNQEEILKDALKEKTTLLSEIHHRVKNNLAIVSGLLELQCLDGNSEFQLPLQRSINRVHSIAMVHELMYQTERLSSVNIRDYLVQLIPAIQKTMQTKNEVDINLKLEDYQLNINQAIPLGLLMNELLTNSFKYAFLNIDNGKIDIRMKVKSEILEFIYRDNGPGFTEEWDFENSSTLGLNLIKSQLTQLHAQYKVITKGKFKLKFNFKIFERGPHSNI